MQIIWKNQSIKGEKKLFVCVVWRKIYSVPETEIIFLYPISMLSQMGQSMCSILEYQTLIDINVVTDDIDLPKRYIKLFFFSWNRSFFSNKLYLLLKKKNKLCGYGQTHGSKFHYITMWKQVSWTKKCNFFSWKWFHEKKYFLRLCTYSKISEM